MTTTSGSRSANADDTAVSISAALSPEGKADVDTMRRERASGG
jgi:hypothetical protein